MLNSIFGGLSRAIELQNIKGHTNHDYENDRDILVVVDMQPDFTASQNRRTIAAVKEEVRGARTRNEEIIIVEYVNCEPTDSRITDLTKDYEKVKTVVKIDNDGSEEILKILKESAIDQEGIVPHLRICGVNTNACVRETVKGLKRKLNPPFQIDVIGDACNERYSSAQEHLMSLLELKDPQQTHLHVFHRGSEL